MKKRIFISVLLLGILTVCCIFLSSCEIGNTETLYVYNWGEYISDGSEGTLDVNAAFEEYCREVLGRNVKVNYSTFVSNEAMYSKVTSGSSTYDVIVPSDYMIERMVKEDLLLPLEDIETKIPNYENILDRFKGDNVYYECGSDVRYSVPYFYGMIGIIYNTAIVEENDEQLGSWDLLWDEQYKGDILQFNNPRDAFGTAQYKLGLDVNSESEEEWRLALNELLEQKKIVQGYVMDEIFNKVISGSAAVAAYYAGDFLTMYEDNEDLAFFFPKEGTNFYIDAMCIPKNAKNPDLAMEYINFMCSEEIAVENALYTYYASPLKTVIENEYYNESMLEVNENYHEILYGEHEFEKAPQAFLNLSSKGLTMINLLWEELKVESRIGVGIYIGCGIILATLAVVVVYHVLQKRRREKLYD